MQSLQFGNIPDVREIPAPPGDRSPQRPGTAASERPGTVRASGDRPRCLRGMGPRGPIRHIGPICPIRPIPPRGDRPRGVWGQTPWCMGTDPVAYGDRPRGVWGQTPWRMGTDPGLWGRRENWDRFLSHRVANHCSAVVVTRRILPPRLNRRGFTSGRTRVFFWSRLVRRRIPNGTQ